MITIDPSVALALLSLGSKQIVEGRRPFLLHLPPCDSHPRTDMIVCLGAVRMGVLLKLLVRVHVH